MLTLLFYLGGGGEAPAPQINFAGWSKTVASQPHGESEAAKRKRRIAQGIIIVPPKPVVEQGPSGTDRLATSLAAVQQKLADNTALQAQTAALRTNAKAVASIARHEAKLARLADEHAAAQAYMAAVLLQIEETDVAFVAAMLMGDD